jgi:hypothetical protein
MTLDCFASLAMTMSHESPFRKGVLSVGHLGIGDLNSESGEADVSQFG